MKIVLLMFVLQILEEWGIIMKNHIFGYARANTELQNLDKRINTLKKYGVVKWKLLMYLVFF